MPTSPLKMIFSSKKNLYLGPSAVWIIISKNLLNIFPTLLHGENRLNKEMCKEYASIWEHMAFSCKDILSLVYFNHLNTE